MLGDVKKETTRASKFTQSVGEVSPMYYYSEDGASNVISAPIS